MSERIMIGLIGFGSMGKTHAYAVQNLKYFYSGLDFDAHICGVCTKHRESAESAVSDYSLGRVFDSVDELVASPDIDVIDICTPNIYHYSAIMKAIAAGKHIYCEKPLCVSVSEAKTAADAARDAGICAGVVFNTRFLLPIIRAGELCRSGALGDILSFRAAFLHSSAADTSRKANWKQDRDICGGGVLYDLGSHIIDLIYYLAGEFESVSGMSAISYPVRRGVDGGEWKTNADEAFYMTAKLKCGACGTISAGKVQLGTNDDLSLEVYGTKGALRFNLMEPNWLYYYDGTADEAVRGFTKIECVGRYPAPGGVFPGVKAPIGWLRGHVGSMYNFLSAVSAKSAVSPSFDDALHVQRVMEAAYRSDETGRRELV